VDDSSAWDRTVDLLVVGSGAGGLTAGLTAAAAGAETLVVEKAAYYGGTTALSGGGIWAPDNPTLRRVGRGDDRESVRAYLDAVVGDRVPAARLDAFVDGAPLALEFLEGASEHLRFFWCRGYADYHPERPGGRPEGRSIEALPFDCRLLGADEGALQPSPLRPPFGLYITATDFHDLNQLTRTWLGKRAFVRCAGRVAVNLVRRRHMVTGGQALVARLRLALREAGGEVWLDSPLLRLVRAPDGRVTGAVIGTRHGPRRVEARRGVILASGGFDHNAEMRSKHLPTVSEDWSMGSPANEGDGIRVAAEAGAGLDLMDDAWWMPVIPLPKGRLFCLVSERAIPGSMIVNQSGERFANESAPYVTFVHEQLRRHSIDGGHVPAWFLMDQRARRRYTFAGLYPGQAFPKSWLGIGTVVAASSWAELAEKTGMPADALSRTVETFNRDARAGTDPAYRRGESAYDRYYGDPTLPNPCLNELVQPPFYAIRLLPGDLGTKGGVTTDEHARVLAEDGSVVPGLYATGNASASVMGNDYPGAGATIGPAIVFGWIAARHALTGAELTAPRPS
jgi:3-oxosteroid 1-dehydrogenase